MGEKERTGKTAAATEAGRAHGAAARTVHARAHQVAPSTPAAARSAQGSPPLIAHLLLFRLHSDVPLSEQHALVDAYATAVRDIPSIRRARVGRRVLTGRAYEDRMRTDFPYAAILEFDDVAGVRAYLDHPAHKQISTRFFAATADSLMYDFEMEGDVARLRALLAEGDAGG